MWVNIPSYQAKFLNEVLSAYAEAHPVLDSIANAERDLAWSHRDRVIEAARDAYVADSDDDIEIDDDTAISRVDAGVFVQMWGWVPMEGADRDPEVESPTPPPPSSELAAAARQVLANWESGDLAGAVTRLGEVLSDMEEAG